MGVLNVYAVTPRNPNVTNIAEWKESKSNFQGVTNKDIVKLFATAINRNPAQGLEIPRDNDPTGFEAALYSDWVNSNFQFNLYVPHDPGEITKLYKQVALWLESSPPQKVRINSEVVKPITSFVAFAHFMKLCIELNLWWEADY